MHRRISNKPGSRLLVTVLAGAVLYCLIACANRQYIKPLRNVLYIEGNDGAVVDIDAGNKGLKQKDCNSKGLFEYDAFSFRIPWAVMSVGTRFRVDSYTGNGLVPLKIVTSGFESVSSKSVGILLRIHNDRFEICDAVSRLAVQDLGPVRTGRFNSLGIYINSGQNLARIEWNGQNYVCERLQSQYIDWRSPGKVYFGASNSDGPGGTSSVTFDWVGISQGDKRISSPAKKWTYYLDGSKRPIDMGCQHRQLIPDNAGSGLLVDGDDGKIVQLTNGNTGIQQKDNNTRGMLEYDAFALRVPWDEISAETRFRIDSYFGNNIVPLRVITGGSDHGNGSNACSIAIRISDNHFGLCDGFSWMVIQDLGPIIKGQFNTISIQVNSKQKSATVTWNGNRMNFTGLQMEPVDPEALGKIEFGASNPDGRGGCSTVTFDWIGVCEGDVSKRFACNKWDHYLDGSTLPKDIGACHNLTPNSVLSTLSSKDTQVNKGVIVNLENGNRGIQQKDDNRLGKDEWDAFAFRFPAFTQSFETRFRVDSFRGNDIMPILLSPSFNQSPSVAVAILIRNKHFTLYDARSKKVLEDLGPVIKGEFNFLHIVLDGKSRSVRLTWNDRVFVFRNLGMGDDVYREIAYFVFGASYLYGPGGTSTITYDYVAVGHGCIPVGSSEPRWDYYLNGSQLPYDIINVH